jgi:hypothetical protein
MLYAFGFDRIGVVVSDLYFVNPVPLEGQEGPEQGVRLELRLFERGQLRGSIYSAQPIAIDRPIWRADLLESVENPGSLDRAHHHPRFRGWEPGPRHFVEEMSHDAVGWVHARLVDLEGLLDAADVSRADVGPADPDDLRRAAPEILDVVRRLLDGVRAGALGQPPASPASESARLSWL